MWGHSSTYRKHRTVSVGDSGTPTGVCLKNKGIIATSSPPGQRNGSHLTVKAPTQPKLIARAVFLKFASGFVRLKAAARTLGGDADVKPTARSKRSSL